MSVETIAGLHQGENTLMQKLSVVLDKGDRQECLSSP